MAQFAAARVMPGVGEAPQFSTGRRVVRDWFNARDRGRASGIYLGGALAPIMTGFIVEGAGSFVPARRAIAGGVGSLHS